MSLRAFGVICGLGGIGLVVVAFGLLVRCGPEEVSAPAGDLRGEGAGPSGVTEPDKVRPAVAPVSTVPFSGDAPGVDVGDVGEPITPRYGPLLERGGAGAVFALVDGRGQPVTGHGRPKAELRLWRRLGESWKRCPAKLDRTRWEIRVGDHEGGLEPGEYEIEASLGSYGVARRTFHLRRGGRERLELRFPGYRRVITFVFEDEQGQAVPFLGGPPVFQHARSAPLGTMRPRPAAVLRSPPGFPHEFDLAFGGSSGFFSSSSGPWLWPTDEGRYHVEVVAGVGGDVRLRTQRLHSGAPAKLTGDFTGPEWDGYRIRLERVKDYEKRVTGVRGRRRPVEPGNRGLLQRAAATPAAPAVRRDPADVRWLGVRDMRLIIEGCGEPKLRPVIVSTRNKRALPLTAGDDIWFCDLARGCDYRLAVTDDGFYRAEVQPVRAEGSVRRIPLSPPMWPVRIELTCPPTLTAWARSVSIALEAGAPSPLVSDDLARIRPAERVGDRFTMESFLSAEQVSAVRESAKLLVVLNREAGPGISLQMNGSLQVHHSQGIPWELTPLQRALLLDGRLELDLARKLVDLGHAPKLALRCVGPDNGGVPWVEGSVIPAEDDFLAQAVREVSRGFRSHEQRLAGGEIASQLRVLRASRGEDVEEILLDEEVEEEDDEHWDWDADCAHEDGWALSTDIAWAMPAIPAGAEDELADALGPALTLAYGLPGLRRLLAQDAWYDTWRRVRSDAHGYVVSAAGRLVPGKLYVLYLWSQSRDDLAPDLRVVFRATPGVTDLGVIRVPGP